VDLRSKYRPREIFLSFHRRNQRWALMVAHRRAGKTVAAVNDLIEKATYNTRPNPRYGYIAPLLKQAKDIAWQYLKDFSAPFSPKINESNLHVELEALPNRPRITIYGADNPDSFRGLYFDGAILDEYGNMRKSVFQEILLPALIDRRGWCVMMGTPNGPNHFRDQWYESQSDDSWFKLFLPVSLTKLIPEDDLAMMRRMMDPEQYAQEMECSFEASVRGAIYARQVELMIAEGRIGDFRAKRGIPVHVVADLGWRDLTSVGFFQERPDGVVVDKAFADNMKPIKHYLQEIRAYFAATGHRMGRFFLPHDAKAKSLQTGKSTVEICIEERFKPEIVTELSLQDGISATRQFYDYLYYNKEGTEKLVLAAKSYHRKYDEELRTYSDEPVHDWSSHWMDMQRYMAIMANKKNWKPANSPLTYGFSLNDLFNQPKPIRGPRL